MNIVILKFQNRAVHCTEYILCGCLSYNDSEKAEIGVVHFLPSYSDDYDDYGDDDYDDDIPAEHYQFMMMKMILMMVITMIMIIHLSIIIFES